MQNVIGIDVSKAKLDVCALFEGKTRKKIVENSESGFKQLQSWISKNNIESPHICMESTGCYSEGVAEFFHNLGFKVSIVNPLRIRAFRKSCLIRQKTDKIDALLIAEFCRMHNPSFWNPKSSDVKELHEIDNRIESLKIELNRASNALEKKLPKFVQKSIKSEINFLNKQIEKLEQEIQKIIERNAELKQKFELLTDIKGVGEKTALAILTSMPDVSNFKKSGQFTAFVGVTPSHKESGTSVKGKSHISKIGTQSVRKTLYMSAINVKNYNPHFQKFVQKLQRKGKPPKVIICAVMRKLIAIFFGMLKNATKFNPNLAFNS